MAAVSVLVLALAVMATLNLGHAVHQKIQLQNAADSAAYSLAAMEARTFNYIAFLNRTQIAHYNTAMAVQSYITWVGFQVVAFGMRADQFKNGYNLAHRAMVAACAAQQHSLCGRLKTLTGMVEEILTPLHAMVSSAAFIYRTGAMLGHQMVEAMQIFNREVIWKAELWRAALLNLNLLDGMASYVHKNDPDIDMLSGPQALLRAGYTAFNMIEYYQAFDNSAGVNPVFPLLFWDLRRVAPGGAYSADAVRRGQDPATREAYAIMAELTNASRWPPFVYRRTQSLAKQVADIAGGLKGFKMGQTRFTCETPGALAHSARIDAIPRRRADVVQLSGLSRCDNATGLQLSSDDYLDNAVYEMVWALGTLKWSDMTSRKWSDMTSRPTLGDAIEAYQEDQGGGEHRQYRGDPSELPWERWGGGSLASMRGAIAEAQEKLGGSLVLGKEALKAVQDPAAAVKNVANQALNKAKDTAVSTAAAAAKDALADALGGGFFGPDGLGSAIEKLGIADVVGLGGVLSFLTGKERSTTMVVKAEDGSSTVGTPHPDPDVQKKAQRQHVDIGGLPHAPWPGLAPYFKFNLSKNRSADYNQPSTWIFLNKPYKTEKGTEEAVQSGAAPWARKVVWNYGGQNVSIDPTMEGAKRNLIEMLQGLNVVARAMAYYHRPEAWNEHPNFFNPFWRARLAPVQQKLMSLWERFVGSNIRLSGDNLALAPLRGILSALRNAQMDMFTAIATSGGVLH